MINGTIVARCRNWVLAAFGRRIFQSRLERSMRVLEEACELAQACDVRLAQAAGIVHRVYGREQGQPRQEAAGLLFTLLVWADSQGVDLEHELIRELERVERPEVMERIRAKHADKVELGIGIVP